MYAVSNSVKITVSSAILFIYTILCGLFQHDFHGLVNWYGWIIYVYAIYTWGLITKGKFISPHTIFFTFFVLFNYGQPLMWALGIGQDRGIGAGQLYYGSGYYPREEDVVSAQWYTCLSMLSFHVGSLLLKKKQQHENYTFDNYRIDRLLLKRISGLIMCIVVPLAIYSQMQAVIIARAHGYGALYYGTYAVQSGYMQIILYLFFPSLVGYLIGSSYSKKSRTIVLFIFALYALLGILSGDRGSWLYSLLILVWFHLQCTGMQAKKVLRYGVIGIIGLFLLSGVTAIRNSGLQFNSEFWTALFDEDNNFIVDAFFEMGGSMGIITYFLESGPHIYPYENTYLVTILGSVSTRFLTFLGIKPVLIADWFSQDYFGYNDFGLGFSMVGEAFVNGGYIGGLIYLFIIGNLIGRLLNLISDVSLDGTNPIKLFVGVSGLNIICGFARGTSYLIVKQFIYGVFLIVLFIYLYKRLITNKNKVHE